MLSKKTATPNLHVITNDDVRRAEAQKKINNTIAKFVAIKVGVTVAIAIAAHIAIKKMTEAENKNSES
jgi:hypothetical protein